MNLISSNPISVFDRFLLSDESGKSFFTEIQNRLFVINLFRDENNKGALVVCRKTIHNPTRLDVLSCDVEKLVLQLLATARWFIFDDEKFLFSSNSWVIWKFYPDAVKSEMLKMFDLFQGPIFKWIRTHF